MSVQDDQSVSKTQWAIDGAEFYRNAAPKLSADDIRQEAIGVISPLLPTKKSIMITISNQINIPLILPKVCMMYGKVFGLFPLKVDPGEICCFAVNQTPGFPRGVGGLITLELAANTPDKYMCIFVYNPVFQAISPFHSGSFKFGWESEIADMKSLCTKMDRERWNNDSSTSQHNVTSDVTGYVISGTLSRDDPFHLCVDVTDNNFEKSIYMQMKPAHTLEVYKAVKTNMDKLTYTKAIVLTVENNLDEALECPKTFTNHGSIKGNLPIRVLPGKVEFILLQRNLLGIRTVSGIVTFQLKKKGLTLCIFMSNPAIGCNRFWIECKNETTTTDAKLYEQIESRYTQSLRGVIGWKRIEKDGVHMAGFMSQGDPCHLSIVVGKGLKSMDELPKT